MTPHITAKKGEIAKIVLMAGDPLRAKFIAENYLDKDYKLVNEVRGMLAFTGTYKGKPVTVMGHGMGIPSIGIYSYELFKFYEVDTIIRIGSCGAFLPEIKLGDIVLAQTSISDSCYASNMNVKTDNMSLKATPELFDLVKSIADKKHIKHYDGLVLASDSFYGETNGEYIDNLKKQNKIIAVEMEAFALYTNAIKLNKKALTILSVSDSISNKVELSADERRTNFRTMMELALDTVVELSK